jgi:hypothetical protein
MRKKKLPWEKDFEKELESKIIEFEKNILHCYGLEIDKNINSDLKDEKDFFLIKNRKTKENFAQVDLNKENSLTFLYGKNLEEKISPEKIKVLEGRVEEFYEVAKKVNTTSIKDNLDLGLGTDFKIPQYPGLKTNTGLATTHYLNYLFKDTTARFDYDASKQVAKVFLGKKLYSSLDTKTGEINNKISEFDKESLRLGLYATGKFVEEYQSQRDIILKNLRISENLK